MAQTSSSILEDHQQNAAKASSSILEDQQQNVAQASSSILEEHQQNVAQTSSSIFQKHNQNMTQASSEIFNNHEQNGIQESNSYVEERRNIQKSNNGPKKKPEIWDSHAVHDASQQDIKPDVINDVNEQNAVAGEIKPFSNQESTDKNKHHAESGLHRREADIEPDGRTCFCSRDENNRVLYTGWCFQGSI